MHNLSWDSSKTRMRYQDLEACGNAALPVLEEIQNARSLGLRLFFVVLFGCLLIIALIANGGKKMDALALMFVPVALALLASRLNEAC